MTMTDSPWTASPDVTSDRAFWCEVLLAGEPSAVPRWTRHPVPGIARYETTIRNDLSTALQRLADDLQVSLSSVLLTAHTKVLAALSGEREAATGYVAVPGDHPLPCRVSTQPASWRGVLLEAHRIETELLSHKDFPVHDLRRELGLAGSAPEAVLDLTGLRQEPAAATMDPGGNGTGEPTAEPVLWVGIGHDGWRRVLRLRYRTDAIDAGCAARIAGYHLTALELIAADPDATHDRQSLLSAGELRFQLDGLAGPRRDLPDHRFHELFEMQVRTRPDAVAAVHGDQRWTYAELNTRANRLGRALLAGGLQREDVVAVVTERTLGWLSAVLAVFKAGGVYLPVEPHFPADRIATMLSRAGCRFVLTEPGSTTTLDQALDSLPGTGTPRRLSLTRWTEPDPELDTGVELGGLGIPVTADQLAYIYFTSGSTGEPKGAMCEHAGMLNHLYAKIDDLAIGEGQVVAQTAPQCFDISLWQLVCALLVGGRTLIVGQDVILDVERFVDTIVESRVAVLQVVPSYLEVVLSYLEQHPRQVPDLRCVSATGEALKRELAQRWFTVMPDVTLVNAYGLTETSDDTNHEVMDRVPDRDRIPLGPCINNVRVYVVDEHLSPVPLGAPGLISFSGVCVGRGYVNDPERTRQVYLSDPYREDCRLYRGGDYGRWLPDGTLEFLGRRDSQVKISGFRIEIGEIENTLLQVPGVRDGAVVVAQGTDQDTRLVAFYTGPQPLDVDILRDRLAESLPEYMLPATFHWQESLPLTANGKTDRKILAARAGELEPAGRDCQAPSTPTEQRLAAAWATVLGVATDQISRHDNFFDRGGTSLAAVRMAIAVDRAVSLKDLTRHPVLCELAAVIDGRSARPSGLLQSLAGPGSRSQSRSGRDATLVCFPYAGANAVTFQPLAVELRGSGLTVHAVELPGHDLALGSQIPGEEPFAPLDLVVEKVVAEITARGLTGILLWGHSSGVAFALATARALTARGADVQRVFLAAQLPGEAAGRQAAIGDLACQGNAEIAATLSRDGGYTELDELGPQHTERLGAAYRHDCVSAHRYLAQALQDPPEVRLPVPVTVVLAADDPNTAGPPDRHRGWESLADQVDLHELTGGGHYFLRSRPADAAQAVLLAAGLPAYPPVPAASASRPPDRCGNRRDP